MSTLIHYLRILQIVMENELHKAFFKNFTNFTKLNFFNSISRRPLKILICVVSPLFRTVSETICIHVKQTAVVTGSVASRAC